MSDMTDSQIIDRLNNILGKMTALKASDLHITAGSHPSARIDGKLKIFKEHRIITNDMIERAFLSLLPEEKRNTFLNTKELDFSYEIPGVSRFRGNIMYQRGNLAAIFRIIPADPPTIEELNLPRVITSLCNKPRGLVLITGPTGSGKSTTLAAMVDYINNTRAEHIVTIEDPIEFLHKNKKSVIHQRELGSDTLSYSEALKHILRQDPDIILIGEMRDLDTITFAVSAAETGHLVFGTVHTTNAASTIDRIIDVFPPSQQAQIRMQLSSTLEGVVCQTLVRRKDGNGRVCATEILVGTLAIRNMIREGKTHMIVNMIQSGIKDGMHTLNNSLMKLVQNNTCSLEDAIAKSSQPDELRSIAGKNYAF